MVQINAIGMSCPQPVLMAKKALEQNPQGIEVLVDNNTAKQNVSRFGKNKGYKIEVKESGENFLVTIKK
ncbi:MAG: sulfurtransferase TusA family protein [Clostridium sp.]|uniref:sulfurtransferase TusA family protein n=1 Tax=Clostridium sp. TaxID=1506 RepID=UPI003D6CD7B9